MNISRLPRQIAAGTIILIGLEQHGYRLLNACRDFCAETLGDINSETVMNIYRECVSQVIHQYDNSSHQFLENILVLPNFKTITYTEKDIAYPVIQKFRGEVRLFAVAVFNLLEVSVPSQVLPSFYTLENCTATLLMLKRFPVNHHVNYTPTPPSPYEGGL